MKKVLRFCVISTVVKDSSEANEQLSSVQLIILIAGTMYSHYELLNCSFTGLHLYLYYMFHLVGIVNTALTDISFEW